MVPSGVVSQNIETTGSAVEPSVTLTLSKVLNDLNEKEVITEGDFWRGRYNDYWKGTPLVGMFYEGFHFTIFGLYKRAFFNHDSYLSDFLCRIADLFRFKRSFIRLKLIHI